MTATQTAAPAIDFGTDALGQFVEKFLDVTAVDAHKMVVVFARLDFKNGFSGFELVSL